MRPHEGLKNDYYGKRIDDLTLMALALEQCGKALHMLMAADEQNILMNPVRYAVIPETTGADLSLPSISTIRSPIESPALPAGPSGWMETISTAESTARLW